MDSQEETQPPARSFAHTVSVDCTRHLNIHHSSAAHPIARNRSGPYFIGYSFIQSLHLEGQRAVVSFLLALSKESSLNLNLLIQFG